ncbi:MAG: M3 family metallopeptidase [Rhizobiales bacterium]|nr:M3 family metallopeptidase [Hyphomicrobiales bacterium]MBO6699315.1 M3 family metallopeptidase [Hyphomicrobiales bacterium]MBO6736853.1 M3 family metallopeptidase [Hyphomicrobiales bacterium]MBO6912073.1 M3 family metallopeptidase [Hyphomicrobiales bacterium]MBO6954559.1 M3 family metallopeptidase [Hyphomicrobiales bacterium]
MTSNPFLQDWQTPFEVPPFADITAEHYGPALDKAFEDHLAEVEAIASTTDPVTFQNTIDALELAGELLRKTSAVFYNLAGSHTNDALQALERELAPKMAKHSQAVSLHEGLFARIEQLWATKDTLDLSGEQARVLDLTRKGFVRAGALLEGAERERIKEIGQRLAVLATQFSQNVLADEQVEALHLTDKVDLAGLAPSLVAAAAEAAKERGKEGWVITLSRSLIEPFLIQSTRRDLREAAFAQWTSRGERGGETDNRAIAQETLALRQERAKLLGYETYAHYKLENEMAKDPSAVRRLLDNVWEPAREMALADQAKLEELAASEGANIQLEAWDWRHFSEKRRQAEFAISDDEVKPYFTLDAMVEAAFATANRLFGLSFKQRHDIPTYHEDVRTYEVLGPSGEHVAVFLGDYYGRMSKRSGAWMSAFRGQRKLGEDVRPIIVNVMNFAKPPAGENALLTLDDVRTLFHEFGHALHGMLSNVTYPSVAGTSVARDFVELPSQLYEHWLMVPDILREHARHAQTGEVIPNDLIERLTAASKYDQGFVTVEYVASAMVDLDMHDGTTNGATDLLAAEAQTLERIGMPRAITMRHRSPHFQHIFSGGSYASGYYSYLWSEVMDADAFAAFKEAGSPFDANVADKLKTYIFAAGGATDPADLYTAFRGRMPTVDALLAKRGLDKAA